MFITPEKSNKIESTPISEQLSVQRKKEESRVMEETFKALVHQRGAVKGKLTRVKNALVHSDAAPNPNLKNVHFLKLHTRTVENCYSEYNVFQNQIYALPLSDERRREQEERYVEFETLYNELSIQLSALLEAAVPKLEPAPPVSLTVASTSSTLTPQQFIPPLSVPLPTFDGTYEAWYSFKSMFRNVMARYATESPAIKLYHLRNALVGKAAGIIDQDIINNGDYEAAWAILTDRFEDKRLIIDKHIEAIFSLPKIPKDSSVELRKLVDICVKNVQALENLELAVNGLGEQMLINQLSSKMDRDTRKVWETKQGPGVLPSYAETIEFLKQRCRIMEKVESNSAIIENTKPVRPVVKSKTLVIANEQKCAMCSNNHELYKCEEFKKKSVSDKYSLLRRTGSCFNCMAKGHRTTECSSSSSCRKCGKKHHTLLHQEDIRKEEGIVKPPAASKQTEEGGSNDESTTGSVASAETARKGQGVALCMSADHLQKQTLLTTAVVLVHGCGSVLHPCRTLIDSCSQNHFITERLATQLALTKHRADYQVSGLNGGTTRIRHVVRTIVKSRVTNFSTELELLIAPKITGDMPVKSIDVTNWNLPTHIELADPTFNQRGRIDMLLGAEIFWDLIKADRITLAENLPLLRETELGWVIGGVISELTPVIARTFCTIVNRDDLGDLLKRFWEIEGAEDLRRGSPTVTDDCIQHFQSTFQRLQDGRFMVRLPFNERQSELGESLQMAAKRFLNLERRLDQRPDLKAEYAAFLREYEQLGHMKEVEVRPCENPGSAYYLPHHCVLRPGSATTKLRVVFDGSARTSTGVSINETLKVGPIVQRDLVSILLNFRCYRFVFIVDILKMFRQVLVHGDDTPFQRIVWRDTCTQLLKVFELLTVTYGMASSPFLATMALSQLADDGKKQFPLAAAALKNSFYVDDALCGANTIEEAKRLCQELLELLRSGGFDAHKWCANEPAILEEIPKNLWSTTFDLEDAIVKTLGVVWNALQDCFSFSISPPEENCEPMTCRKILSEIAKFFDPLGLCGPVVTTAKLIFREVGLLNLNWDEAVPAALAKCWRDFREELCALNDLQLPRWILHDDTKLVELHGFGDASDAAYGACLYTRLVQSHGDVTMKLVCSKSRILPKKSGKNKAITTPRAELLAALLLSRMVDKTTAAIDLQFTSVTLWSDSTIVLSWIQKPPAVLQQFVSNRVAEIQQLTNQFSWRYISTKDNPADLVSRGERPKNLMDRSLWWNGPAILKQPVITIEQPPAVPEGDLPEIRSSTCLAVTASVKRLPIFERIGNFEKLQRSMGYVVRFAYYIVSKKKMLTKGSLTVQERDQALKLMVRLVQREAFQPELQALKEGNDAKHRLRNLNPFIDSEDGVLRVGGRIKRAFVPYDSRHQMLLPAKHPLTEALIRHEHLSNIHAGQKALLAIVRQRFWPLQVKNTIRKVIRQCIPCFRANPMKTAQLMGDLPSYRVQPAPAFFHSGVDFAGPFLIKSLTVARKPMITKGYICLFVCLSTRAIHLELVSSLTTDAFLAALRRFTGRRGPVSKIYSDNATNFTGAESELEQLRNLFADEHHTKQLTEFCGSRAITWSFIPPRSPHFGGIWEAGVKSVKHHLKRVVGNQKLTFEELSTVLVQIEAVLNSRPLTPCSDDPNDFTAITPAHFLVGRQMQSIPEPSYTNLKLSTLSRWQLVQATQQHFWKRWISEYLPEMQNRQKWFKITRIQPGALVLINDANAPPMHWQLGRIIQIHPGDDNITRVVTLRTARGECKRGVTEISLLPLDGEVKLDD